MFSDGYDGIALGVESAWPTPEMRLALGATTEPLDVACSEPAAEAPASLIAA